jgi:hypothetical protein
VKDRLNEKRSFFGRQGIKIIADFFKDEPYSNKPKEIAKYARWATRGDGPAIFSIPTPISCTMDKDHHEYIVSFHVLWSFQLAPNIISRHPPISLGRHLSSSYSRNFSNGPKGQATMLTSPLVRWRWQLLR